MPDFEMTASKTIAYSHRLWWLAFTIIIIVCTNVAAYAAFGSPFAVR